MQPHHQRHRPKTASPARRGALSITMWVFGLATTLLLVGLWGRAVTLDQQTVTDSAAAVVDADLAQERIYEWIEKALVDTQGVGPSEAAGLVSEWRDRPEFKTAIDNIIDSFVGALFAPPGPAARIDVHAAVAPAIPVIVEGLERQDVAVDEGTLVAALGDASVLELDTGGASTVATIAQEARVILSRIVVLSILTMLVSGTVAIILSDETYAMVRTLAIRVSLSALSFAILFRIGSWALDPEGGRSPIASGGSVLLGSNGHVFIIIFVMASAVGIGGAWVAFNRRRAASARYGPDPLDDQPTGDGVRPGVQILDLTEDDTKEFVTA